LGNPIALGKALLLVEQAQSGDWIGGGDGVLGLFVTLDQQVSSPIASASDTFDSSGTVS
jgi:hypothetical protein